MRSLLALVMLAGLVAAQAASMHCVSAVGAAHPASAAHETSAGHHPSAPVPTAHPHDGVSPQSTATAEEAGAIPPSDSNHPHDADADAGCDTLLACGGAAVPLHRAGGSLIGSDGSAPAPSFHAAPGSTRLADEPPPPRLRT